jgi:hypothetical protein
MVVGSAIKVRTPAAVREQAKGPKWAVSWATSSFEERRKTTVRYILLLTVMIIDAPIIRDAMAQIAQHDRGPAATEDRRTI